jgi:hypothetical protein
VTAEQAGRSLSEATASSRFTTPNFWADPKTGVGYQVQVQYPQPRMTSIEEVQNIPVMPGDAQHPLMGDLARVTNGTLVGEYDRVNGLWLLTLSANTATQDLGGVTNTIDTAIRGTGTPPRGVTVQMRGQIAPMRETFTNLGVGLLLAVAVIFLLLAALIGGSDDQSGSHLRRDPYAAHHSYHVEPGVVHGSDHGHWRSDRQRHSARDLRGTVSEGGSSIRRGRPAWREYSNASHTDDQHGHDCWHGAHGPGAGRGSGSDSSLGKGGDRGSSGRDRCQSDRAAFRILYGSVAREHGFPIA